jgi:adenine-specific DNA-methyltransferase
MWSVFGATASASFAAPLGQIADVGIGYVTGANAFFHVNEETIRQYEIPSRFLKRAVRRGRALQGLWYTDRTTHLAELNRLR